MKRLSALEASGKPVPAKDQALKAEWDKWVADGNTSRKAVSDAQRKLTDSRGIAELSLSRPNGATVDATKFDGEMTHQGSPARRQRQAARRPVGEQEAEGDAAAREDQGRDRQGRHRPLDRHDHRAGVKLIAGHAGGGARHLVRLEPAAPRDACRAARRCRARRRRRLAIRVPLEGRGPGKRVVRSSVVDEAERPLAGFEGRGDHLSAPDGLKTMLRPGCVQWRSRVDGTARKSAPQR